MSRDFIDSIRFAAEARKVEPSASGNYFWGVDTGNPPEKKKPKVTPLKFNNPIGKPPEKKWGTPFLAGLMKDPEFRKRLKEWKNNPGYISFVPEPPNPPFSVRNGFRTQEQHDQLLQQGRGRVHRGGRTPEIIDHAAHISPHEIRGRTRDAAHIDDMSFYNEVLGYAYTPPSPLITT
jgi:hypothetical protein